MSYTSKINGESRTVDVGNDTPLLWVLRDELDLKGSKFGCGKRIRAAIKQAAGLPTTDMREA
jgi:aerobic-type carbon monoxide dehydrogenase small subunit (CoxS/CutS family)